MCVPTYRRDLTCDGSVLKNKLHRSSQGTNRYKVTTTINGTLESIIRDANATQTRTIKCNAPGCLTCKCVATKDEIISTVTNTSYTNRANTSFNCKDKNLIYCIECKKCGIQYVGETTQPLHERVNGHRADIKNNKKDTFLVKHFNQTDHNIEDLSICVINTINNNKDSNTYKAHLRNMELVWIRLLNTAYPFGLNDSIKGYGNISDYGKNPLENENQPYFNSTSMITRNKRKRGAKRARSKRLDNGIIDTLEKLSEDEYHNGIYTYLRGC